MPIVVHLYTVCAMAGSYDVVVAGAGPAGSLAAYHLARAGYCVLLVEREHLPRYKPCGGGVTLKSLRELPFPIDDVVERDVCEAEIRFGADRVIRARGERVGTMVMRSAFDAGLARRAVEAGAELCEGVRVRAVRRPAGGRIAVETTAGEFRARCVIGADGANSVVAMCCGLGQQREWGIAIEAEIDLPLGRTPEPLVVFDFRAVPGGYAYVFPKARHSSVGVYTIRPSLPQLRACLDAYIQGTPALRDGVVRTCVGHKVPLGRVSGPLHRDGVLLAGDAAGLGDPLWGEGIFFALRSGRIAAEVVNAAFERAGAGVVPRLSDYDTRIRRELAGDLRYARAFARFFYRFPRGRAASLARDPLLAQGMMDILRGQCSYRRFVPMVLRRLPALLASRVTA
ncbi:MAG: NAD(P)/FAD-dependent oxidoreductase [Acidobacteriota bacterium]